MKFRLNGKEFDNQKDYRKALRESEDRDNAYEPWSDEEESRLIEISETKSISELADHFKRTELGIISRLAKLVESYEIQTEFYENGLKKNEGLYYVGSLFENTIRKKEGEWFFSSHGNSLHHLRYLTEWYESGQIKSQGNYIGNDDSPHGKKTEWFENGQMKFEGEYRTIDGGGAEPDTIIKVGKHTVWYENAQKKSEGSFYDCWGVNSGEGIRLNNWELTFIHHYDNTSIGLDYDDDDDLIFAKIDKWTEWYENGQKKSEGRYKDLYYDGKWTFWYENGQKKLEGSFKDGYQLGKHIKWYEDGQKKSEYHYKDLEEYEKNTYEPTYINFYDTVIDVSRHNGEIDVSRYRQNFYMHGKCSEWNEDGQLTTELKYKNGQGWDGFWTKGVWGANDLGISQGQFKKGKKEGRWLVSANSERFDENGNMIYLDFYLRNPLWIDEDINTYGNEFFRYFSKREINYKNDKLHGRMIYWDSDGSIKRESTYKNDLLDGIDAKYENGQIEREKNYIKGEEHGKETWWYENGQKMEESNYKNGMQNGKWTMWDENGQIESEANYIKGEKLEETSWWSNGQKYSEFIGWSQKELDFNNKRTSTNAVETYWYPDGSKKQITHYKDNEKHGTYIKWHANGIKQEEINFKFGKEDGCWISWNENGKVETIKYFKDGVEVYEDEDIPF